MERMEEKRSGSIEWRMWTGWKIEGRSRRDMKLVLTKLITGILMLSCFMRGVCRRADYVEVEEGSAATVGALG